MLLFLRKGNADLLTWQGHCKTVIHGDEIFQMRSLLLQVVSTKFTRQSCDLSRALVVSSLLMIIIIIIIIHSWWRAISWTIYLKTDELHACTRGWTIDDTGSKRCHPSIYVSLYIKLDLLLLNLCSVKHANLKCSVLYRMSVSHFYIHFALTCFSGWRFTVW